MSFKEYSQFKNIDLRSEKEFLKGTIPGSINIPILCNEEYQRVGKQYKSKGQEAATKLGFALVNDDLKKERIDLWIDHIKENPGCYIFCYKGGLRSKIAHDWLKKENIAIERLQGGYKEYRSYIISQHSETKRYTKSWKVIGGLTGSGKTELLNQFDEAIDLERIANHRGSAFGKNISEQPTQANFENIITDKYLNHISPKIYIEDESRTIGRVALPETWYKKMQSSDLVVLDISTEERVSNISKEYVTEALNNFSNSNELLAQYLSSLEKIKKRLGGELFKNVSSLMINAFKNNKNHQDWVFKILDKYYDPMYEYKLSTRKKYITHIGDYKSCYDYLKSL